MHPPDLTVKPGLGDDFGIQNFSRFEEAQELEQQTARRALTDPARLEPRDDQG